MGKRQFPEYVIEEHARSLFHYHEWTPHDQDLPDHVPDHLRPRYRGERCTRCDAVRWLHQNYQPGDERFDGFCIDDTDKHTYTEGE